MERMKTCSKCNKEFLNTSNYFFADKQKKDGLRPDCKTCTKLTHKKYREANKDKIKERLDKNKHIISQKKKEYRNKNKKKISEYNKDYSKRNREKIRAKKREYYKNNKDKVRNWNKKSSEKRKDKIKVYKYHWKKDKLNNDPLYKLKESISNNIRQSLRRNEIVKAGNTSEILGCDIYELNEHLIRTFILNYHIDWDESYRSLLEIDHVIPVSSASSEKELYKLNHYSNLQYLFREDNQIKFNKLNWELDNSKSNFYKQIGVTYVEGKRRP